MCMGKVIIGLELNHLSGVVWLLLRPLRVSCYTVHFLCRYFRILEWRISWLRLDKGKV